MAKKKKKNRISTVSVHLCELLRVVKFIETESRSVVARGLGERGMGSWCLMSREFQFCKMKKLCGWVVPMVAKQGECMPLNCTFKHDLNDFKNQWEKNVSTNFYFRQALTCRAPQINFGSWEIRIIGKVPWKAPSPNPRDTNGWDS